MSCVASTQLIAITQSGIVSWVKILHLLQPNCISYIKKYLCLYSYHQSIFWVNVCYSKYAVFHTNGHYKIATDVIKRNNGLGNEQLEKLYPVVS